MALPYASFFCRGVLRNVSPTGEQATLSDGSSATSCRKHLAHLNSYKKILIGMIVSSLLIVSLTACGIREASTIAGPTVHMGADFFFQPSITIRIGDPLTLVDDSTAPHLITNGSWVSGVAKPEREAGAPAVDQAFNGNDSATVGPFNTPGAYHLYCTIHQSMNLTVIVTV